MPRRLRIVVYSVLLALSLYMYWLSGQRPQQPEAPPPSRVTLVDPLSPSSSLNVRRDSLTGAYERVPFNLQFSYVPLADGRSRVIGRSEDGRTVLELVGPPEGVTSANLMAALPSDRPLVRLKNLNAISLLVETTLFEWAAAPAWVSENIDTAFAGRSVTTQIDGKRVSMSVTPRTETLVITVAGPPL